MSVLEDVAFVKRGKNRYRVFLALTQPALPSELARAVFGSTSNTHFNMVSRALSELSTAGLVEIINPAEKTGRIYRLTKRGTLVRATATLVNSE